VAKSRSSFEGADEGAGAIRTFFRCSLRTLRGCWKCLFPGLKDHRHDPVVGLALRRGDGSRVHIERDP